MPMNRELYPDNWDAIALAVKESANWTCQECGRPCRKPGVDWCDFELWLFEQYQPNFDWWDDCFDENETCKPTRFVLTVAHLDHTPANCSPKNLKAMCAPCHLRYDAGLHRRTASGAKYRRAEKLGQQSLELQM